MHCIITNVVALSGSGCGHVEPLLLNVPAGTAGPVRRSPQTPRLRGMEAEQINEADRVAQKASVNMTDAENPVSRSPIQEEQWFA